MRNYNTFLAFWKNEVSKMMKGILAALTLTFSLREWPLAGIR
jgi:hypothetical protein